MLFKESIVEQVPYFKNNRCAFYSRLEGINTLELGEVCLMPYFRNSFGIYSHIHQITPLLDIRLIRSNFPHVGS